jgi:hypothetical protein
LELSVDSTVIGAASTPTRLATACDVIFCRSATWPQQDSGAAAHAAVSKSVSSPGRAAEK